MLEGIGRGKCNLTKFLYTAIVYVYLLFVTNVISQQDLEIQGLFSSQYQIYPYGAGILLAFHDFYGATEELNKGVDVQLDLTVSYRMNQRSQITFDDEATMKGCTMLHVLICTLEQLNTIQGLPTAMRRPFHPRICNLKENKTLGDSCVSYPVESDGMRFPGEGYNHVSSLRIRHKFNDRMEGGIGILLDTCEFHGGNNAMLRSCVYSSSDNQTVTCFACPAGQENQSNSTKESCTVPPELDPVYDIDMKLDLCTSGTEYCLISSPVWLRLFYFILSVVWCGAMLAWFLHILLKSQRNTRIMIILQIYLTSIPVTQYIYTLSILKSANGFIGSWWDPEIIQILELYQVVDPRSLVGIRAISILLTSFYLMALSSGWKITRYSLQNIEVVTFDIVGLLYGIASAMIRYDMKVTLGKSTLFCALSILLLTITIWNNYKNMQMLKAQIPEERQHESTRMTPEKTKYQLFQYLLAHSLIYMGCGWICIPLGIMIPKFQGSPRAFIAILDFCELLLICKIGFHFRCQTFSHVNFLTPPSNRVVPTTDSLANETDSGAAPPTSQRSSQVHPFAPHSRSVIVVLNPDNQPELGEQIIKSDTPATSPKASGST